MRRQLLFFYAVNIMQLCYVAHAFSQSARQSADSIDVWYTKDFIKFVDDFFYPRTPSKTANDGTKVVEAKKFYQSQLPLMLERRLGVWESDEQDFSDFSEWRGAKKLCLKVLSANDVRLELVRPDGSHASAPDSADGFITSGSIFLGPINNGLLFNYVMASNHIYSLFSPNGLQKRMRFVKKRSLHEDGHITLTNGNPSVAIIPNYNYDFKCSTNSFWALPNSVKYFASIAGLYCNDEEFVEDREKTIKSYIMINRHGEAYSFRKLKSSGLLYVSFPRQPRHIDRYRLGGARYYMQGQHLIATMNPSSPMDEFEMLIAYERTYRSKRSCDLKMEHYLRMHDIRLIDWYEYPNTKRQSVYKKIPDIVFNEDDFVLEGMFFTVEMRKKFVDMLNHGKKFSEVFGEKIYDPSLGAF